MSTQVNLYEAKAKLSDLVERAVNGKDIVIARAGRPRVRLVAVVKRTARRQPGRWKNKPVALVPGWDDRPHRRVRGPVSRLLLDTHVVLWWLTGAALDADVHAMIRDPDNVVLVSVASAWEVALKQSLGRLDPPEDFADAAVAEGLTLLGIELAHVRAVRHRPHHHRDPFDRMLVAQAQVERLTLVTRDARLGQYDVRTLAA